MKDNARLDSQMGEYREWMERAIRMPPGDERSRVLGILEGIKDNLIRASNLCEVGKDRKAERLMTRADILLSKLSHHV
jgi:hypothetical protein